MPRKQSFLTAEEVVSEIQQERNHVRDWDLILYMILEKYREEGIVVPYTMKDLRRDAAKEYLFLLTAEERLEGLSANERLRGIPIGEILQRLSADEIRQLRPDERRRLKHLLEAIDDESPY